MKRFSLNLRRRVAICGLLVLLPRAAADLHVSVTSTANSTYTTRKFDGPKPRVETYVFMQGKYFEGTTVDRSIERMPFRRIAEFLAPELARQQYLPTKEVATADLLIVVHWGTTIPFITSQEMTATTSATNAPVDSRVGPEIPSDPNLTGGASGVFSHFAGLGDEHDRQLDFDQLQQVTEQLGGNLTQASNSELLGYGRDLRRHSADLLPSEEEIGLRYDLTTERYFIILQAFDLKEKIGQGQVRRPIWTVHLNMRSPGINFSTAIDTMSKVVADYAGRTTDRVKSVNPVIREGKVIMAPLIILGEAK